MADIHDLDALIVELAANAVGDPVASARLQGCLIAGLGTTIATHAEGDRQLAAFFCDRAAESIYEATTLSASLLDTAV